MTLPSRTADVAVVGAGLSGLVAAHRLIQAGVHSVVVLEAKGRVGGRTVSKTTVGDRLVDGGAQWIGPGQDRVAALASELGVETFATYDTGRSVMVLGGKRRTHPSWFPFAFPGPALDFMRAAIRLEWKARNVDETAPWSASGAERLDATTLHDWLITHTDTAEARVLWEVASGLALGGDPRTLSLLGVLQHLRSAGGISRLLSVRGGAQERRFVQGAQELSLRIAQRLGDRVLLSSPVSRVTEEGAGVVVHSERCMVRARQIVVALSPAERRGIEFAPRLPPAMQGLIEALDMFKGIKCQVTYQRPFWRAQGLNGQAIGDRGPAAAAFDSSPADGSVGILTTFVAATTSDSPVSPTERELADAGERKAGVLACLARYFGEDAREPIDYVEQDWRTEPFTAGCIPTMPAGFLTQHGRHVSPRTGPIVWAGTESAHVWNGYMDGAVRAGEHAAELVLGFAA